MSWRTGLIVCVAFSGSLLASLSLDGGRPHIVTGTLRAPETRVVAPGAVTLREHLVQELDLIRQGQVCAVGFEDVLHSLAALPDPSPSVVTMRSQCLSDVWSDLRHVANALGVEARGTRQIAALRERLSAIEKRRPAGVSPRVACLEWMDPLMIAGNWVPELMEIAGGTVIAGRSGAPSDWLTWDALRAAAPDVIIVAPCGFSLQRTRAEWDVLAGRPEWSRLPAVSSGRVYQMDGDHFLNRPGPRLVESVEILAEILYPDHFAPQHRGLGWMPV